MAVLRGEGVLNDVNVVANVYDSAVYKDKESGEAKTHYIDFELHKDDPRAEGQTVPNLRFTRGEAGADGKAASIETKVGYKPSQLDAIKEAAGDNKTDLVTTSGEVVGTSYAVKANLFPQGDHFVVNTKTVAPSELSVVTPEGEPTYRQQAFEQVAANRAAKKEAAATAEAAPAAEAVEVEAPAKQDEPSLS